MSGGRNNPKKKKPTKNNPEKKKPGKKKPIKSPGKRMVA